MGQQIVFGTFQSPAFFPLSLARRQVRRCLATCQRMQGRRHIGDNAAASRETLRAKGTSALTQTL